MREKEESRCLYFGGSGTSGAVGPSTNAEVQPQLFVTSTSLRHHTMDIAYDHIQEEIFSSSNEDAPSDSNAQNSNINLNTELQETFRAFSASPWGTRIGGLWDNVRKQGESYYEGARQEYAHASEEAVKGLSDLRDSLVDRTKGLSLSTAALAGGGSEGQKDEAATPTASREGESKDQTQAGSSGEGFISRFKAEAARRLKEIEKAEEAADEAIMRFGLNIGQKLREAISIVPPETDESGKLLFESKDADGKRVIHATRFEAQLHVIHSNLDSFTQDPVSDKFPAFKEELNVESKTDEIASDLERYPELRSAMEKLVPETVEYTEFWTRYYFLRLVIETEEKKRKELLKGTVTSNLIPSGDVLANIYWYLQAPTLKMRKKSAGVMTLTPNPSLPLLPRSALVPRISPLKRTPKKPSLAGPTTSSPRPTANRATML